MDIEGLATLIQQDHEARIEFRKEVKEDFEKILTMFTNFSESCAQKHISLEPLRIYIEKKIEEEDQKKIDIIKNRGALKIQIIGGVILLICGLILSNIWGRITGIKTEQQKYKAMLEEKNYGYDNQRSNYPAGRKS